MNIIITILLYSLSSLNEYNVIYLYIYKNVFAHSIIELIFLVSFNISLKSFVLILIIIYLHYNLHILYHTHI